MTAKTVQARNLRHRKPMAYLGTPGHLLTNPVYATAYTQKDGIVTLAVPGGKHIEVKPGSRVVVDYDPENVKGVKGLRYCHRHEGQEPHLRYIAADKSGTALCGHASERVVAAKAAGFTGYTEAAEAAKKEALDAMVARAHQRMVNPPSREHLQDVTLRNIARDLGLDSKRFATVAAQYRIPLAEAVTRANRALAEAGQYAATTTTASSEVA